MYGLKIPKLHKYVHEAMFLFDLHVGFFVTLGRFRGP